MSRIVKMTVQEAVERAPMLSPEDLELVRALLTPVRKAPVKQRRAS